MEKQLNPLEEAYVAHFADMLSLVHTIDKMFPPDESGVREPRPPRPPFLPCDEQICLAAVYDLSYARRDRRLLDESARLIDDIDQLVPA